MSETIVHAGTGGDFLHTGFGTKREVSARNVMRQLARELGPRGSRRLRNKRLDYRRHGDVVTVYEEVPMVFNCVIPGIGYRTFVSIPITTITADYSIRDIRRNKRTYQGESSSEVVSKVDQDKQDRADWEREDIKQAMSDDVDALEKGRQFFSGGSYRG